jgi:hypothetical protein
MKIWRTFLISIKKIIPITVFSITLVSCSLLETNRIAPGYIEAYKALNDYFFSDKKFIVNSAISQIPYASLKLRIGSGEEGLLILQSKNKYNEYWVSADQIYVQIRQGRIIATDGLINNLKGNINLAKLQNLLLATSLETFIYLSYDEPELNNLRVKSILTNRGKETISLFSGLKELTLIEEELSNDYLGWKVLNKYWIDESGYCWKSEQNISPLLPTFYLEVAKKPA